MADRELRDYEAQKRKLRERQDRPAKAQKAPEWNRKDPLDPTRASRKLGEEEPKDSPRGRIDRVVTSKGYTETRRGAAPSDQTARARSST